MHEVCFRIGEYPVKWYGVMMALGFMAGLIGLTLLGGKEKRDFNFCSDLVLWVMVSGILGARIAYVFTDLPFFLAHPLRILEIWRGGLVYYGGFVGAALGVMLFARARRERFLTVGDFLVTVLPLGHFFGRVGCFLNGCCYGRPYSGLLGVRHPLTSAVGWAQYYAGMIPSERVAVLMERLNRRSITADRFDAELGALADKGLIGRSDMYALPVHPVQLYEAFLNLLLFALLVGIYRKGSRRGRVIAAYLMGYPAIRFLTEFCRGDERAMLGCLTVAQAISMALFVCGAALCAWVCTRESPESDCKS